MPTWKRKRVLKIFLIERGFDFFMATQKILKVFHFLKNPLKFALYDFKN